MRTVVLLLTVMTYPAIAQACEPGWETFPDGQTNTTYAVIEHEGVVYRGGWFSLFRWTESYWQTFGGGIGGDSQRVPGRRGQANNGELRSRNADRGKNTSSPRLQVRK